MPKNFLFRIKPKIFPPAITTGKRSGLAEIISHRDYNFSTETVSTTESDNCRPNRDYLFAPFDRRRMN